MKDILVRAKLPKINQGSGECKECGNTRCSVWKILKNTSTFEDKNGNQYSIRWRRRRRNVLVTCKSWKIQYVGSTDPSFRVRVNNYKACYRKHISGKLVPLSMRISLRRTITAWKIGSLLLSIEAQIFHLSAGGKSFGNLTLFELNTFHPDGLNERDVPIDYG